MERPSGANAGSPMRVDAGRVRMSHARACDSSTPGVLGIAGGRPSREEGHRIGSLVSRPPGRMAGGLRPGGEVLPRRCQLAPAKGRFLPRIGRAAGKISDVNVRSIAMVL